MELLLGLFIGSMSCFIVAGGVWIFIRYINSGNKETHEQIGMLVVVSLVTIALIRILFLSVGCC